MTKFINKITFGFFVLLLSFTIFGCTNTASERSNTKETKRSLPDEKLALTPPISNDRIAIAFLNRNSSNMSVAVSWNELELDSAKQYSVYDLWEHKSVSHAEGGISTNLKPHECQVFVLSASETE